MSENEIKNLFDNLTNDDYFPRKEQKKDIPKTVDRGWLIKNIEIVTQKVKGKGSVLGFYEAKIEVKIAMWERGKYIDIYLKRVGTAPSYSQLAKELSRSNAYGITLKKWHETYLSCPNYTAYLKIAEKEARHWTDAYLEKLMIEDTFRKRG